MMKHNELKKKYIQAAYEIICVDGRIGVTIRRLGKMLDCNAASLYRCFQDLDELFLYTGLKYVKSYLRDLYDLLQEPTNNMQRYLKVWECFMSHAFANPKMYNSIFFGAYSSKLGTVTEEYYTLLFPQELIQFDEKAQRILIRGSFHTGDSMISQTLLKCVADGFIREENREYLDRLFLQIFKGYLKDFIDGRLKVQNIESVTKEIILYYEEMLSHYLVKSNVPMDVL